MSYMDAAHAQQFRAWFPVEAVELEQLRVEIVAMRQRAEAAEAALAAVPVESIYYVWLAAVAHSRDNGNYASKDTTAVDVWLAAQQVKPWEVKP